MIKNINNMDGLNNTNMYTFLLRLMKNVLYLCIVVNVHMLFRKTVVGAYNI